MVIDLLNNKLHEFSITQSLLDIVAEKAREIKAEKVSSINIVIGELSGVEQSCVKFYFDFLKKDYGLEDASLNFKIIPATVKCRDCGSEFSSEDLPWACPDCNSNSVSIINGSECYLESIEVE